MRWQVIHDHLFFLPLLNNAFVCTESVMRELPAVLRKKFEHLITELVRSLFLCGFDFLL
jgi:hypothetical protein